MQEIGEAAPRAAHRVGIQAPACDLETLHAALRTTAAGELRILHQGPSAKGGGALRSILANHSDQPNTVSVRSRCSNTSADVPSFEGTAMEAMEDNALLTIPGKHVTARPLTRSGERSARPS